MRLISLLFGGNYYKRLLEIFNLNLSPKLEAFQNKEINP